MVPRGRWQWLKQPAEPRLLFHAGAYEALVAPALRGRAREMEARTYRLLNNGVFQQPASR